jgi:hypothetical protein
MAITWDWLLCQTTPAEVEADLADLGAPDLWLRRWRALLDRMGPGDELWEYGAIEYASTVEESPERFSGFHQVLDSETLQRMGFLEPLERIIGFRTGFAVVRGAEILDWIEAPASIA